MCRVTPFLGVWIEIDEKRHKDHAGEPSLPSWECGLKFYYTKKSEDLQQVTPFLGVWIEINSRKGESELWQVTPFLGVWIEIGSAHQTCIANGSHSLLGSVD